MAHDLDANGAGGVLEDAVVIAGAGPVGLFLAHVLSHFGVKSMLLERNESTTRWPKMDLTNGRSMELLRKVGLADSLRKIGVASHFPSTVILSSGLHQKEPLSHWWLPSVDEAQRLINSQNDGTLPLEAWQRGSQSIFEAWLKDLCEKNPLVEVRSGWAVESMEELGEGTVTVVTDRKTGEKHQITSKYGIGCDGANSMVRKSLGIELDGGPLPAKVLLVNFKSRDLSRLHKQGQFWHIFFPNAVLLSGAIIAQDEIDTWTTHLFIPLDMDGSEIDPEDAIYTVLGGLGHKYPITVDEILVKSTWRPSVCVAQAYSSRNHHIFLCGDAVHQNVPTGGYGMNSGLGDAFDIAWKIAAVLKGWGGPQLLESYQQERLPVAAVLTKLAEKHLVTYQGISTQIAPDPPLVDADSKEGRDLRNAISEYFQLNSQENTSIGAEMGFRYESSIVIPDETAAAPEWHLQSYIPNTYPGRRAPHVFLDDGKPIFDMFGKGFTLVEFVDGTETGSQLIIAAAEARGVPLEHVQLHDNANARKLWEKRLVLVRPDDHVAWRGDGIGDEAAAKRIIEAVAGFRK